MKKMSLEEIKNYLGVNEDQVKLTLTPKQAKYLLSHCNKKNRRMSMQHVETLKRDMESGNWFSDTDHIGFDRDGCLVNGQHRLKALATSNVDAVQLKFDFDAEQHVSMDTGRNRGYAAQVAISKKNGFDIMPSNFRTIVSAGLRLNDPKIKLSNSELMDIWQQYKTQLKTCEENGLFDLGPKGGATVKSSFLWAYLSGVDLELLKHIAKVLKTGITQDEYDIPVIRLRDELFDLRGSGKAMDEKRAAYTQQMIYNVVEVHSKSNRLPSNPVMHYQSYPFMEF